MRIDAVKSYFGPSMNPINDPHPSMKATKEFLWNIEKQAPKNEKVWDKKTVYAMFAKDTDYFFKQIIARYSDLLDSLLDDQERYEFADHLESLVSFSKFCKEKADEV